MTLNHKPWMSSIAMYLGLAAAVNAALHAPSAWYLVGAILIYLAGSVTLSAGYHRLFCHAAYKAHKVWHWMFAFIGTALLHASPMQWIATHAAHHIHSDTDRDPHPTGLSPLFWRHYRPAEADRWMMRRLLRQGRWHVTLHEWYVPIYLLILGAIALISTDFLLYSYLPALGFVTLMGNVHNTFGHQGGEPLNLWWMEYIIPSGGEWLHRQHHERPRDVDMRTAPYHLDMGFLLIKAIRS